MKMEKEEAKRIGNNIKQLRIKSGLTQKELGQKIGNKSQTAIYHYENGDVVPNIDVLIQMSEIFRTRLNDIIMGEF